MRVLMLGWEFPPYFAGGVGTVCYELTRGLAKRGVQVTYVMPHGPDDVHAEHVKLLVADAAIKRLGFKTLRVNSLLKPYISKQEYSWNYGQYTQILKGKAPALYADNILDEMYRFALALTELAAYEEFDIIHAHDWTTIPAAIALKKASGKPLVLHVHITEFDKTGGEHADSEVYRIEREGFHAADKLIAVSQLVKRRLIDKYGVPPERITVIHNTVEALGTDIGAKRERLTEDEQLVLFLGRVTLQKGPDYFLEAAARVSLMMPNVKFVVAGTGDMLPRMIERAAQLGIAHKVIFTGFVTRDEGDRLYSMADLFVMPSVSEPFGIVPLEAMKQGTPVIISKQSGVSEVITHALKVDFWDVEQLANKIIATLSYTALHTELRHHTAREIKSFTWETPAEQCRELYNEVLGW